MIRFELDRTDADAVQLALVACRLPLRVERSEERIAIVATEEDAHRARSGWLRAGLEPRPCARWPEARALRGGVLEVSGVRRCIVRAPVDRPPRGALVVLALAPVQRADALRAVSEALRAPIRLPFRRARARSLAIVAATILAGRDGVAAVRAFAVFDAEAPTSGPRVRSGTLGAWHAIETPDGGVWRSLAALQTWWQPRRGT